MPIKETALWGLERFRELKKKRNCLPGNQFLPKKFATSLEKGHQDRVLRPGLPPRAATTPLPLAKQTRTDSRRYRKQTPPSLISYLTTAYIASSLSIDKRLLRSANSRLLNGSRVPSAAPNGRTVSEIPNARQGWTTKATALIVQMTIGTTPSSFLLALSTAKNSRQRPGSHRETAGGRRTPSSSDVADAVRLTWPECWGVTGEWGWWCCFLVFGFCCDLVVGGFLSLYTWLCDGFLHELSR